MQTFFFHFRTFSHMNVKSFKCVTAYNSQMMTFIIGVVLQSLIINKNCVGNFSFSFSSDFVSANSFTVDGMKNHVRAVCYLSGKLRLLVCSRCRKLKCHVYLQWNKLYYIHINQSVFIAFAEVRKEIFTQHQAIFAISWIIIDFVRIINFVFKCNTYVHTYDTCLIK